MEQAQLWKKSPEAVRWSLVGEMTSRGASNVVALNTDPPGTLFRIVGQRTRHVAIWEVVKTSCYLGTGLRLISEGRIR